MFMCVPYSENGANALAHEQGEGFGRTISRFRAERLDITDNVCPAELQKSARPVFVIFEVSGKAVGDDNAVKAFPLDKGFEQVNGMSVFVYEIIPDAASNESKNVACQMGNAHPGKNKKTQVIGDEVERVFPGQNIPADE